MKGVDNMATYLKGDIHGDFSDVFAFIKRFNLNENDNIIILGDCGIAWRNDKKDLKYHIEQWKENSNGVKLYFIDGNHENFDILNKLPIENNMGKVADGIYHLLRGQTYYFDGKKVLVCGGADSIDLYRRVKGLSWWPEETILESEIDAIAADHYDYVLTHCCPRSVFESNKVYLITLDNINQDAINHYSENMLEKLMNKITFNKWFFAHYHVDRELDDKFCVLFNHFELL